MYKLKLVKLHSKTIHYFDIHFRISSDFLNVSSCQDVHVTFLRVRVGVCDTNVLIPGSKISCHANLVRYNPLKTVLSATFLQVPLYTSSRNIPHVPISQTKNGCSTRSEKFSRTRGTVCSHGSVA